MLQRRAQPVDGISAESIGCGVHRRSMQTTRSAVNLFTTSFSRVASPEKSKQTGHCWGSSETQGLEFDQDLSVLPRLVNKALIDGLHDVGRLSLIDCDCVALCMVTEIPEVATVPLPAFQLATVWSA